MLIFNRLKHTEVSDQDEVIRRIEQRDMAFRISQSVFAVMMVSALVFLIAQVYSIQKQNNDLLKRQEVLVTQNTQLTKSLESDVSELKQNDQKQLSELQNHIDCIVHLFQQPNFTSLKINDVQNCNLVYGSSFGGATMQTKSK